MTAGCAHVCGGPVRAARGRPAAERKLGSRVLFGGSFGPLFIALALLGLTSRTLRLALPFAVPVPRLVAQLGRQMLGVYDSIVR